MVSILKKIPIRKAVREKGKSLCVAAAVFFTTVLFVMVFSTLFFVMDAAAEMMKASSPMLSDAVLNVTEEEYERICANPRVAETSTGIIVARMRESSGAGLVTLYDAEEQMARWMRYYPVEGRMPGQGNEIVVSDQYLRERGLTYREDLSIDLTFTYLDEKEHTETFTVVGVYKRALQPYHAVLVSDDFYGKACAYWEQCGLDPREEADQQAGVMFSSRGSVRRLASMMVMEAKIDLEEGEIYINDISLLSSLDFSTWAALLALVLLVMWLGYLFISNIFHLSVTGDARFFGKLSTNGITRKEIKKLIRRQNNILFLAVVIPALLVGYLFSAAVLPGILSAFMTIQARGSGNGWIFVLAFAFSYLTVRVSERKPMKLAKNASPVEMKRYIGGFRRVKTADDRDCLKKFVVRHFQSDKIKVLKVCVSIAVSILLANVFYAVTAGFDVELYVEGDLDADYILAKESVFTNPSLNPASYERIVREEIAGCRGLPGVEAAGGASRSHICLLPTQEEWDAFEEIWGEGAYSDPGKMWTGAYGLDAMLLQKLQPVRGTIDLDQFQTGKYILLDPILSDDNTENVACYQPGDEVTIPFASGEVGTYTVMAIVEELPESMRFPGRYYASNVYLPMPEWQDKEHRDDYYLYAFDVEEAFHGEWDEAIEKITGDQSSGLACRSAKSLAEQAGRYINGLKLAGFVLSAILLAMGVLNFINCMVESVYSRSRELAILESMGIGQREIEKNLAKEGMLYMAGGFVPGCLLAVFGVYAMINMVLQESYIAYHFYPHIYLLFAVLGSAVAVLVPLAAYRQMDRKEKFLYRIRSCRE